MTTRRDWLRLTALLVTPLWLEPLAWRLAFTSHPVTGFIGAFLIQFELALVPAALATWLAVAYIPVALFFRRLRRGAITFLCVSLFFTACCVGGLVLRQDIWRQGLTRVAANGQPIIDAIGAYQARHGRPPQSLDELVPEYLTAIPATGVGAHPEFRYEVGPPGQWDDNPWVLCVVPPCLVMGFDRYLYFPLQNYPRYGYGGGIERIGTWGFVHE